MRLTFVVLCASAALGCSKHEDPSGEARPERYVVSDDGLAVLWVPDGGAPASAAITLTANHTAGARQYTLEPSGLTFEPAAWLFVAAPPAEKFTSVPTQLIDSNGTAEDALSATSRGRGHSGALFDYSLVQVKHFSAAVLGREASAPGQPYLELDGPSLDGFTIDHGNPWTETLTVTHQSVIAPLTAILGKYTVTAADAVELVSAPQTGPIPGMAGAPGTLSFQVKCKRTGPGSITVAFDSALHPNLLAHTYAGTCDLPMLERQVESEPSVKELGNGFGIATWAAVYLPGEFTGVKTQEDEDEEERARAEIANFHALLPKPDVTPHGTVGLTVECQKCELDKSKYARARITAAGGRVKPEAAILYTAGAVQMLTRYAKFTGELDDGQSATVDVAYFCARPGMGEVVVDVEFTNLNTHVTYSGEFAHVLISCDGKLHGDAIMLSDNSRASRSGGVWALAAAGVTANVIQAAPMVDDRFVSASTAGIVYSQVGTFTSNGGLTPLTLRSGRQTGTATFSNGRYALTGLVGGAAYNATDTLTVEHVPAAGPTVSVSVPAPPPVTAINTLLGAPAGWDTVVSVADGTFDTLYVFVGMAVPTGAPAGEYGVMRFAKAADMTLAGGMRSSPLLDAETKAAIVSSGLRPTSVYLAYFNTTMTGVFFPGQRDVPVQAGRMVQLTPADLGL